LWLCWEGIAQPKLADPLLLIFSETHSRCYFMPTLKLVLGQVDCGRANQSKFIDLLASLEHQLMAHSSVHATLLKSFAIISVSYTVEGWLQKTAYSHGFRDFYSLQNNEGQRKRPLGKKTNRILGIASSKRNIHVYFDDYYITPFTWKNSPTCAQNHVTLSTITYLLKILPCNDVLVCCYGGLFRAAW